MSYKLYTSGDYEAITWFAWQWLYKLVTINIHTIYNSNSLFTSIDNQWPGSVNDNRILSRSWLIDKITAYKRETVVIGDVGN